MSRLRLIKSNARGALGQQKTILIEVGNIQKFQNVSGAFSVWFNRDGTLKASNPFSNDGYWEERRKKRQGTFERSVVKEINQDLAIANLGLTGLGATSIFGGKKNMASDNKIKRQQGYTDFYAGKGILMGQTAGAVVGLGKAVYDKTKGKQSLVTPYGKALMQVQAGAILGGGVGGFGGSLYGYNQGRKKITLLRGRHEK